MTRRKFQLYLSDCEVVAKSLTDKQLGRLFKAIIAYMKGEPTEGLLDTPQIVVAFGMMKGRLDEDLARRQAAAQRNRENGAKGGRPRKNDMAHAETHPIEKATATEEEPGEKTHSVIKKPTRLLKNPLGFTPLQSDENQAITETHSVFTEKPQETGSEESSEEIPPTPPLYNTQDNKNLIISAPAREVGSEEGIKRIDAIEQELLTSSIWFETICKNRRISPKDLATYIMDFCNWLRETESFNETAQEARRHFINQLPFIIKKYQQSNGTKTPNNNTGNRRQDERLSRAQGYAAAIASLAAEESRPD